LKANLDPLLAVAGNLGQRKKAVRETLNADYSLSALTHFAILPVAYVLRKHHGGNR